MRSAWARDEFSSALWIDWYDAALDGRSLDFGLIKHISEVNARIPEEYVDFQVNAFIGRNPYALDVEMDGRTGRLIAVPVESPDLKDVIDAVRQVLRDFNTRCRRDKSANNMGVIMKSACAPVIEDLRRDLTRYRENPLQLHDALVDARRELERIAQIEGFSSASLVGRLLDGIERAETDILDAAPAVLETEKRRAAVRFERVAQEQAETAIRLCQGMQEDSEGLLRIAASTAVQIVLDPSRSDDEKKSAW